MQQPKISVIIPNWNGKKWLQQSLNDLSRQTYRRLEIIIIDNNSSDDSLEWTRKHYPKVKIVASRKNLGFGKANNLGIKKSSGSEIFLLNNDTKLPSDLISTLLNFKLQNKLDITGPRLLDFSGKDTYASKKISIDPLSVHGWGDSTFFIEGCALLISKKNYQKLGGFDPAYFMYSEDIDLCWRAWIFGLTIGICETASIIHYGGGSSQKTMHQQNHVHQAPLSRRYEVEKNNLRNVLKNYQPLNLVWVMCLYLIQTVAELLLYIFSGNYAMAKVLLSAISWNIRNIKDTLKQRRRIQCQRKVSDLEIFKIMTPPFNKIRTFLQIGMPVFN